MKRSTHDQEGRRVAWEVVVRPSKYKGEIHIAAKFMGHTLRDRHVPPSFVLEEVDKALTSIDDAIDREAYI